MEHTLPLTSFGNRDSSPVAQLNAGKYQTLNTILILITHDQCEDIIVNYRKQERSFALFSFH